MHESARRFIDGMGLQLEAEGLARSAGRIFGYLLLTDGPSSLDELAETLQVSKAAVSTNARLLEAAGLLERACEPGDRRDFYRMRADAWDRLLLGARARWEERQALLASTAALLPEEMSAAKRRLEIAERFHALFAEELSTLIERWRSDEEAAVAAGSMVEEAAGGR